MKKAFLLLALMFCSLIHGQNTYIHCTEYFNSANASYEKGEFTIIVNEDKIVEIYDSYVQPKEEGAQIINLKENVVYPGFIDMHVHMESETNPNKYLEKYQDNEADIAFKSLKFAKSTLMAGFTTVRDVGGTGVNIALKNAIERGEVVGPRIFTSGKSLATTGGHADPTNGSNEKYMGDPGPKQGVVAHGRL